MENFRIKKMLSLKLYLFIFLGTLSFVTSCNRNNTAKPVNIESQAFKEKLIDANKMYVKQESDEIDRYVEHHNWKMTTTGTGLRYMITKNGTGAQAEDAKRAKVNYKISLLDGTLCYSSDSTGAKEFLIGQDNVESGLHEGIKYMHVGDKAVMILPSHLAHGLVGDDSKIPPHASVMYELELLSLR